MPTPEVIAFVANRFTGKEKELAKIDEKIDYFTQQGIQAIQTQNWYKFAICLTENQKLMVELGVCNEQLEDIIRLLAMDLSVLAAKISGSGLGDSVIALQRQKTIPNKKFGEAFAPSNIALIKYWGKRSLGLNLPVTGSLSISLGDRGTKTKISISSTNQDEFILNDNKLDNTSGFAARASKFLDLFRPLETFYKIETTSNIPVAAGLASSASGFAALTLALDDLYEWNLTRKELSILARLGSGSAARSMWQGFVEWHRGEQTNGLDSYAEPLNIDWPEFCIGLVIFDSKQKKISSRDAMLTTVKTSKLYKDWHKRVAKDLITAKKALQQKDFSLLGKTAEDNAIAMHATMADATPSISYTEEQTEAIQDKVRKCRKNGLEIYFTQDAGPNLKILFLSKDKDKIKQEFENIILI
jgi:diphosphomevalonate decarboxylase